MKMLSANFRQNWVGILALAAIGALWVARLARPSTQPEPPDEEIKEDDDRPRVTAPPLAERIQLAYREIGLEIGARRTDIERMAQRAREITLGLTRHRQSACTQPCPDCLQFERLGRETEKDVARQTEDVARLLALEGNLCRVIRELPNETRGQNPSGSEQLAGQCLLLWESMKSPEDRLLPVELFDTPPAAPCENTSKKQSDP